MTLTLYEIRRWLARRLHALAVALYDHRYFCDCEGVDCPDGTRLLCLERNIPPARPDTDLCDHCGHWVEEHIRLSNGANYCEACLPVGNPAHVFTPASKDDYD